MKIAFVHCWLFPGGALNVLKDLIQEELRKHPQASCSLFTMIADEGLKTLEIEIPGSGGEIKRIQVKEALPNWINQIFLFFGKKKIPLFSQIFDYRNLMLFYPQIMKFISQKVKKYGPQKILISSFAIAKNLIPLPGVETSLYLHSPMQYIWSHYPEYEKKITGFKKKFFDFIVPQLRSRDLKYTTFDSIRFNSHYTASLAQEIYSMKGKVSYPKVNDLYFYGGISLKPQPYYVCIGRLVTFVREMDFIIQRFNESGLPLLVIGSGPDEIYLKSIAKDNILFLGRLSPEETKKILKNARGLINLTKESFGLGTVEALLLGVPVLGFGEGATPELVDEKSGILIPKKEKKLFLEALKDFDKRERDRKYISDAIRTKLVR